MTKSLPGRGVAREDVLDLLRRLPDDVTLEDVRYHIDILEQVKSGLESADAGAVPEAGGDESRGEAVAHRVI